MISGKGAKSKGNGALFLNEYSVSVGVMKSFRNSGDGYTTFECNKCH